MCSETSLNHTFRSVWNSALGAMVAVPESASGHSGGSSKRSKGSPNSRSVPNVLTLCVALAWGGLAGNALANPEGGVVIAGQANMASNGNKLLVTTQNAAGTNHSAINWQSFSIPSGSSTYFQQPSAASTVINQVVTSAPSLIFGTLGSNGNVVLINQSGITVGAGAVVDTAGFTASVLRMSDADARAGLLHFGDANASGGTVSVQGSILARSGDVVLIGAHVETGKDALIQAPNGSTLLAAGQRIGITGRGLEGISLEVQAPTDSAVNLGTLQGDAVGIFASTLKHSGAIQANAVSTEGGKVVLKGVSALDIDGTVQASASGQRGGTILASAQHVVLASTAMLDASGALGGGEVLVGGGYQGHDARLANAQTTQVQSGAQLRADALTQGDGGTVVVWADGATRYAGAISAQGGAAGGNGGRAEVSGKQYLDFQGLADLRAAQGTRGSLLLDPTNIVITNEGSPNIAGTGFGYGADIVLGTDLSDSATYSGLTSQITASQVSTLLNTTDVSLAATNDITVSNGISKTGSAATTLTMNAGHDIIFGPSAGISSSAGALNVSLTAANAISTSSYNSTIQTNGGNVNFTAGTGDIAGSGGSLAVNSSSANGKGGNVVLKSGGTINTSGIDASGQTGYGGGSVSVNAGQDLALTGNIATSSSVSLSATGNLTGSNSTIGDESTKTSSISISSGGVSGSLPSFYSSGNVSVTMTGTGSYVFDGRRFINASSVSLATPNGSISASQYFNSMSQLVATAANGIDITYSSVGAIKATNTGTGNITFSSTSASSFEATNSGTGNINFTNLSPVTISGLSAANGNITVDNTGGITTTGAIKAPNGAVSITAHSPITIGTGGITAGGAINLTASTPGPTSNITINGNVQSTGNSISMTAGNNLVQNAGVIAAAGITATATGTMSFGPNGYSSGSPLSYSDASGSVRPPLVPLSSLGNTGGSVSDFLDQFLAALDAQRTFSDDPFDPRNRRTAGLVVEGQICTP